MSYSGTPQLFDPQTGVGQRIGPYKATLTSESIRLIGSMFNGTLTATVADTGVADNFWSVLLHAATGGAASGIANLVCTLTSGSTASNYVTLNSVRRARWLTMFPNLFHTELIFPVVAPGLAASSSTYFGAMTMTAGLPTDGYCFKVDGTGALAVQSYVAGTPVLNAASGFNGELGATYTIPNVNKHAYEILYRMGGVQFYIDGRLLHTATPTNALFSLAIGSLPIGVSVVNGGTPTTRTVIVWYASVVRYGKEVSRPQVVFVTGAATTLFKTGAGTLHRIMVGSQINNATIKVYDGLTAVNQVANLVCGSASTNPGFPFPVECDFDFYIGLTIVTDSASNISVIFD